MSTAPVVWRVQLASPPDRVFDLLATRAGRESFWAEEAPEEDGVILFRFANGQRTEAPILSRDPPDLFELAYFGAVTRFELESAHDGTLLTLTASGIPEAEWIHVHAGWVSVLLLLKAAVDHGVDLRTHDPRRSWDSRHVDQ